MSRKQTIIILHYKYTVARRRDRVRAPAPTAAAGRVHYTRRGGIIRPTYSSVLAFLFAPVPSVLLYLFLFSFLSPSRMFMLSLPSSHGLQLASLFFTLAAFVLDSSQKTVYATLNISVFLEGFCPRILINALSIYLSLVSFCHAASFASTFSPNFSGLAFQTDRIARHRGV